MSTVDIIADPGAEMVPEKKVVKLEDALRLGLSRYFTALPCRKGHVNERRVKGRQCVGCHNENARLSRARLSAGRKFPGQGGQHSVIRAGTVAVWPSACDLGTIFAPTSHAEAVLAGATRYFTGTPCASGHIDQRMVGNGGCVACAVRQRNGTDALRYRALMRMIETASYAERVPSGRPILRRQTAIEAGQKVYFDGTVCKAGHIASRYVGNLECVVCSRVRNRERYARDKEFRQRRIAYEVARNRRQDVRARRLVQMQEYNRRPVVRRRLLTRLKTEPVFRLTWNVRSLLRYTLKKRGYRKSRRLQEILRCSIPEFIHHIERQFTRGMSWTNQGAWEIDHIVPLSTARTEAELTALFCHTNMRPLWKRENRSKGAKRLYLL